MIGLDTNILVRFVTDDDPIQSPIARAIIERRLSLSEPGFISLVTIAETAWVLLRRYRFPRERVAAALTLLLRIEVLIVEEEAAVFRAIELMREAGAAFGDALIGTLNIRAGCAGTLSFDRKALRLPGFRHPEQW